MEGCKLSSQKSDFNIFSVNLITDATAIPLGWLLYASDDAWAEDARDLLTELAADIPEHAHIIVLGDRVHTGEPFLERLDELHWDDIFRAPSDTLIETRRGSQIQLGQDHQRTNAYSYALNGSNEDLRLCRA